MRDEMGLGGRNVRNERGVRIVRSVRIVRYCAGIVHIVLTVRSGR